MEEKYVGTDIHRDYGVACVQDTKGKIVDEFRFGNDIEGINRVKEKLDGNSTHIAIESTGNMWILLWDKLEEIESQVINKIRSIFHKYCIKYKGSLRQKAGMEFLDTLELRPVDMSAIKSYLATLKILNSEIDLVNSQIADTDVEEVRLLMSIPGIDYYSAVLIHSEIGDISRFPSHNKLASWTGLVPSMHQSGTSFYNGRITKEGSKRLRWILIQCAHTSIRTNSKINDFYTKIAKRRGENKAVVAVARKLVKIIYAVLSSKQPSLYGDPKKTEMKIKRMKAIAEK